MLVIIGGIVVFLCVFGGFAIEGGDLGVLWQPIELLIICGAALGSLLISASPSILSAMGKQIAHAFTAKGISKAQYLDLLLLLYELIKIGKSNPLGLEPHVETPENSEIFKRYPTILHNHHAVAFIADTIKVQVSSPMSPYDLEDLMDTDLHSTHAEEAAVPSLVTKVSDAMPGLGIVAAVLGVVITMGKLTMGKEVIGHSVGAALVGTFIGILASYGFLGPLAGKMEAINNEEGQFLSVAKAAMLAFAKEASPKVCVEFARRTIPPAVRPSFQELDQATSGAGKKAA